MKHSSLPGIREIRYVRCADLADNLMLHAICGDSAVINAESEKIDFCGTPTLSWESGKTGGNYVEKSTLEFSTTSELPTHERIAFVVTAAGGESWLIGAREPNFPTVSFTHTTGAPGSGAAVRTYKITHTAQKSVLPCVL